MGEKSKSGTIGDKPSVEEEPVDLLVGEKREASLAEILPILRVELTLWHIPFCGNRTNVKDKMG